MKIENNFFLSFVFQKPHDLSSIVDSEEGSFLIMSQAAPSKSDDHLIFTTSGSGSDGNSGLGSILMDESVSMDEFKMSPATDALEYLLNAASQANAEQTTLPQNDEQVTNELLFAKNQVTNELVK